MMFSSRPSLHHQHFLITLPEGYTLVRALPEPAKKTVSNATWHDVDFIPEMTYEKKKTSLMWAALAVLVVFLIAFYAYWIISG